MGPHRALVVNRYLVDTDVLIDVLRGARRLEVPAGADVACSVLTRVELLSGKSATTQPIHELLDEFHEVAVTPDIATRAGGIRRDHGIALADAVIAATALATERILLSRNLRHVDRVTGLAVERPT